MSSPNHYVALKGAFLTDHVTFTSDHMKFWGDSTANPLTRAFGGGDGIRTHGLYIANVAVPCL